MTREEKRDQKRRFAERNPTYSRDYAYNWRIANHMNVKSLPPRPDAHIKRKTDYACKPTD